MSNKRKRLKDIRYAVQLILLISLVWRGIFGLYLQIVVGHLDIHALWAVLSVLVLSILSTFGLFCWIVRSNRV